MVMGSWGHGKGSGAEPCYWIRTNVDPFTVRVQSALWARKEHIKIAGISAAVGFALSALLLLSYRTTNPLFILVLLVIGFGFAFAAVYFFFALSVNAVDEWFDPDTEVAKVAASEMTRAGKVGGLPADHAGCVRIHKAVLEFEEERVALQEEWTQTAISKLEELAAQVDGA